VRVEPVDIGLGQEITVGEQRPGHRLAARIDHRVDQQLQGRHRQPGVASRLGDHGGEVPARTVPADRHPPRIGVQVVGMLHRPAVGSQAVRTGGGCLVLWGQAVVDRQDVHAGVVADTPAQTVVGAQAADDKSATVQENQQRRAGLGGVMPDGQLTGRSRNGEITCRDHDRSGQGGRDAIELMSRDGDIIAGDEATDPGDPLRIEHQLQGGVERVALDGDRSPAQQDPFDGVRNSRHDRQRQPAGDGGELQPERAWVLPCWQTL
jgi:hypothetical protein